MLVTLQTGFSYMASGALDWTRRFIEVGQSVTGVLPSSQALRLLAPEMVLGAVIASPSFTWLLSLPTWGSNVDRPVCRMHHPTGSGWQIGAQSPLTGIDLSHRPIKIGAARAYPLGCETSKG
jgi:hypothetical protein